MSHLLSLICFFSRVLFLFMMICPYQIWARYIKFPLSAKSPKTNFLSIENQSACTDLQRIDNNQTKWPYFTVSPPWEKYSTSHLYKSYCLMQRLSNLFETSFESLPNVSYGMIMNAMSENNCTFYLHGGVVRDLLQGEDPHDVDGEFPCDPAQLQELLVRMIPSAALYFNVTFEYFYIGNKTLDIGMEGFHWDMAFFNLEEQEYTPNSMYFDTTNNFLIDLSGNGVEDAIKKQIRIPIEREDWDLWLFKTTDGEYLMKKFLRKIPRYWKLRASGYKSDNETLSYLKNVIQTLWNDEVYDIKNIFFEYTCIMTEALYDNLTFSCGTHNFTQKVTNFCKNLMRSIRADLLDLGQNIGNEINLFTQNFTCEYSDSMSSAIIFNQNFLIIIIMIFYIFHY